MRNTFAPMSLLVVAAVPYSDVCLSTANEVLSEDTATVSDAYRFESFGF